MDKSSRILIIYFILFATFKCGSASKKILKGDDAIRYLIQAFSKLLSSISANLNLLTPQNMYPISIANNQLLWMLNSLNNSSTHYPNLLKLYKKSAEIIAEGWPSVQGEEDYEDYYSDMTIDELIEQDSKKPKKNYFDPKIIMAYADLAKPWIYKFPQKLVHNVVFETPKRRLSTTKLFELVEKVDRIQIEECIHNLVMSREAERNRGDDTLYFDCDVSAECENLIFKVEGVKNRTLELREYVSSVVFLQFYRILKCRPIRQTQELIQNICENVYFDMNMLLLNDKFDLHQHSLMEYALFCALEGYGAFLNETVINKILSWQTANGCFRRSYNPYYDQLKKTSTFHEIFEYPNNFGENQEKSAIFDESIIPTDAVVLKELPRFISENETLPKYVYTVISTHYSIAKFPNAPAEYQIIRSFYNNKKKLDIPVRRSKNKDEKTWGSLGFKKSNDLIFEYMEEALNASEHYERQFKIDDGRSSRIAKNRDDFHQKFRGKRSADSENFSISNLTGKDKPSSNDSEKIGRKKRFWATDWLTTQKAEIELTSVASLPIVSSNRPASKRKIKVYKYKASTSPKSTTADLRVENLARTKVQLENITQVVPAKFLLENITKIDFNYTAPTFKSVTVTVKLRDGNRSQDAAVLTLPTENPKAKAVRGELNLKIENGSQRAGLTKNLSRIDKEKDSENSPNPRGITVVVKHKTSKMTLKNILEVSTPIHPMLSLGKRIEKHPNNSTPSAMTKLLVTPSSSTEPIDQSISAQLIPHSSTQLPQLILTTSSLSTMKLVSQFQETRIQPQNRPKQIFAKQTARIIVVPKLSTTTQRNNFSSNTISPYEKLNKTPASTKHSGTHFSTPKIITVGDRRISTQVPNQKVSTDFKAIPPNLTNTAQTFTMNQDSIAGKVAGKSVTNYPSSLTSNDLATAKLNASHFNSRVQEPSSTRKRQRFTLSPTRKMTTTLISHIENRNKTSQNVVLPQERNSSSINSLLAKSLSTVPTTHLPVTILVNTKQIPTTSKNIEITNNSQAPKAPEFPKNPSQGSNFIITATNKITSMNHNPSAEEPPQVTEVTPRQSSVSLAELTKSQSEEPTSKMKNSTLPTFAKSTIIPFVSNNATYSPATRPKTNTSDSKIIPWVSSPRTVRFYQNSQRNKHTFSPRKIVNVLQKMAKVVQQVTSPVDHRGRTLAPVKWKIAHNVIRTHMASPMRRMRPRSVGSTAPIETVKSTPFLSTSTHSTVKPKVKSRQRRKQLRDADQPSTQIYDISIMNHTSPKQFKDLMLNFSRRVSDSNLETIYKSDPENVSDGTLNQAKPKTVTISKLPDSTNLPGVASSTVRNRLLSVFGISTAGTKNYTKVKPASRTLKNNNKSSFLSIFGVTKSSAIVSTTTATYKTQPAEEGSLTQNSTKSESKLKLKKVTQKSSTLGFNPATMIFKGGRKKILSYPINAKKPEKSSGVSFVDEKSQIDANPESEFEINLDEIAGSNTTTPQAQKSLVQHPRSQYFEVTTKNYLATSPQLDYMQTQIISFETNHLTTGFQRRTTKTPVKSVDSQVNAELEPLGKEDEFSLVMDYPRKKSKVLDVLYLREYLKEKYTDDFIEKPSFRVEMSPIIFNPDYLVDVDKSKYYITKITDIKNPIYDPAQMENGCHMRSNEYAAALIAMWLKNYVEGNISPELHVND